jgi:hypothetical protein
MPLESPPRGLGGALIGQNPREGEQGFALGLTLSDVEEFRAILRDECGEVLNPAEAWTRAILVLSLFKFFLNHLAEQRALPAEFEHPPA